MLAFQKMNGIFQFGTYLEKHRAFKISGIKVNGQTHIQSLTLHKIA